MNDDIRLRRLTGFILILMPIAFNVFFTLLSVTFEYPDILREPASYVLRTFEAGGSGLVAVWYGFMLTAVLFVAVASWSTRSWRARTRLTWRLQLPSGLSLGWCSFSA